MLRIAGKYFRQTQSALTVRMAEFEVNTIRNGPDVYTLSLEPISLRGVVTFLYRAIILFRMALSEI